MKSPKVRFRGYTDDWEERKLSELTTMHARIGWQNLRTSEFLNSGDYMLITGTDFEDGAINYATCHYVKKERYEQDKHIQIHNGSILITKDGTLGKVAYVQGLTIPATLNAGVFNIEIKNKNEVDEKYLFQYLKAPFLMEYVSQKATGGTIKHLNQSILVDFPITMPSKIEQVKIGEYFRDIDKLITLHQRKCEEIKTLKKYMLQKMFPQNGMNVPEIRFNGFTDTWEQRKFGDLADYKKGPFGSALKKDIFVPKDKTTIKVYEQQNAINKDWSLERYFITKEYAQKLSAFKVEGGDIIVSCAGTIGETYEIPIDAEPGIINQALMKIKVKELIISKKMFIILFTNMIDDFTRVHSNGSAIKNIPPFSDLKSMEVLVPCREEQEKISSYVINLDHLITLHQQKCDELQNIKKFMLQNMFV